VNRYHVFIGRPPHLALSDYLAGLISAGWLTAMDGLAIAGSILLFDRKFDTMRKDRYLMERNVLVAYATTHGSTQEVAAEVAKWLRECGLTVDLQLARNVSTLDGYSLVVLGSPLYMFHWHKDALRFLSRHKKALAGGLPLAVFAGGPFGENSKTEDWQEVRKSLEKELAHFPWLFPAAMEIIGGKFDPAHLRFPYNLIPALKQMPPSDLRDWETIHAWAASLPALLEKEAARG
jgi:menaquinone-dependent protoporphyrinogen oxidase